MATPPCGVNPAVIPLTKAQARRSAANKSAAGSPAMKLALVCGVFVASPYIFYQLWKFVAPGLYKEERRIIIPVSVATAVCFVGGALFGYFVVFPFGFKFFVDYAAEYITIMMAKNSKNGTLPRDSWNAVA